MGARFATLMNLFLFDDKSVVQKVDSDVHWKVIFLSAPERHKKQ